MLNVERLNVELRFLNKGNRMVQTSWADETSRKKRGDVCDFDYKSSAEPTKASARRRGDDFE